MKKLRIFTAVWGDHHIARFKVGLLRSLLWPRNQAALRQGLACWHLSSRTEDFDKLRAILDPTGFTYELREIDSEQYTVATKAWDARTFNLCIAAKRIMKQCRDEGSLFMVAFADIFFGDGTVDNLINIAQKPRVAVLVPHMRVFPSILRDIGETPLGNAALCSLAIKNAHHTWIQADMARAAGNQYFGGIAWEKVDGLYLVQHQIPNVWIANIEQSDIDWWDKEQDFSKYDHNWPELLVNEERSRIIGSSDAAFVVEITDIAKALCVSRKTDPQEPDKFYRGDWAHHRMYRNMVSVWRAG